MSFAGFARSRRIRAARGIFPTVLQVPSDVSHLLPRSDVSHRWSGFSFLEVAVTLVLLGILAGIGYAAFATVRDNTEGTAAGPVLVVAQLEARRLSASDGSYASTTVADLVARSTDALTFTDSAATDVETVSVYRVDEESLVLATVSGDDCLVLLDRPFASSTWAIFKGDASLCTAGGFAAASVALTPGGSASAPQEVVTGG